jgi:uncharacterized Zn-finger protein
MINSKNVVEVKEGFCPFCGKKFHFKQYLVVHSEQSLEVAEMFTCEDGFEISCPHCGVVLLHKPPVYYVDNANGVWLLFARTEEKVNKMLENLSSHEGDLSEFKYVGEATIGVFTKWDRFAREVQKLIAKTKRKANGNACIGNRRLS